MQQQQQPAVRQPFPEAVEREELSRVGYAVRQKKAALAARLAGLFATSGHGRPSTAVVEETSRGRAAKAAKGKAGKA